MKTKEINGDRLIENVGSIHNKFVDVVNDFTETESISADEITFTIIKATQFFCFRMITAVAEDKETAERILKASNKYLQKKINDYYEQLDKD